MRDEDMAPLDPTLEDLFEVERCVPEAPARSAEGVWEAIAAGAGGGGPGGPSSGGDGDVGDGGGGSEPGSADGGVGASPSNPGSSQIGGASSSGTAVGTAAGASSIVKLVGTGLVTMAVGWLGGAYLHPQLFPGDDADEQPSTPQVASPAESSGPLDTEGQIAVTPPFDRASPRGAPPAEAETDPPAEATPGAHNRGDVTERAPRSRPRRGAQETGSGPEPGPPDQAPTTQLSREREMIDAARAALRRDPAQALSTLARHERQFPRGSLTEERDSLRIQALLVTGGEERALRAYERFRRRYPGSIFLSALDAAMGQRLERVRE